MFRVFYAFLILLNVSVLVAGDDDTYVFEAKGKFAKELKALVEKYSKDGKVDIKVLKIDRNKKNRSIFDTLLNTRNNRYDLQYGKEQYIKKCSNCHGLDAATNSYANSRKLVELDKEELKDQIENYKNEFSYGGSTGVVMKSAVEDISSDDIVAISNYIYSIKHNKDVAKQKNLNLDISSTPEETSSYLK